MPKTAPTLSGRPDAQAAQALYRQRAAVYDAELVPFESLRREAVGLLGLQPGQRVLDLGCGTGLSLPLLAAGVGPAGEVWGVELCPEMAEQAGRRQAALGPAARIHIDQAAAAQAPWPPALRADAALFHFTHDILQQPEALDQVMAHLRPGARVVACGLQWAPAWAWACNAWVLSAALYSVTTLQQLHRPWQALARCLPDLEVHSTWMGCVYLAVGHRP